LGRVRVGRGLAALELRLHRQVLVAREVRALRGPPADGRHVERHARVGDLRAVGLEEGEAEAVLPGAELLAGRREHGPLAEAREQLAERLPAGLGEVLRAGGRWR